MSNFLENGAVLPHGLLNHDSEDFMGGFNKSYRNYPLRVGIVTTSYPVSNENNHSKLTTEYDVLVIEQNEDKGATTIQYRNCLSAEGLGSIADFFEKALRPKKKKSTKGDSVDLKGQDGAIVLMLCLDGMSDKGIIIGALTHPDRKTNLVDGDPFLEGEYNGVNIKITKDGSATFTFKGATNSEGKPIDSSQGNTTLKIEKDGSFQADHDTISFRMARDGTTTLKGKKDINLTTDANVNITASKKVNIKATGDVSIEAGGDCKVKASGKATVKASSIELNGDTGMILTTTTMPLVDLITGTPSVGVPNVKAG